MVTTQELYYDSRDHASRIHAVKWIPENEVKAVLILVHGMAEYIERYNEFATYLAERGILVAGNSHLGHGKSIGENGKPGYFCKQDAATVLVRDVHRLKKMVQQDYPGIPCFIMGHSMGSFVVRNYLCRYGTGVEGAIIMGTGMPPKALAAISKGIARLQMVFLGDSHPGKMLDKLAFGGYNKKIENPKTAHDWLSVSEENVRAYKADDLCGFLFTVNGFHTLFELIYRLHKPGNLKNMPVTLPVLFIAGGEDPVGDYGEGVKKVAQSFKDMGMQDVTLSIREDVRHEILNEDDRVEVYEEIFQWITEKED